MPALDFFLDPMCPFAWQTSRWVRQVQPERDLDVTWRFVSLAILNADGEHDDDYAELLRRGAEVHRILAATRELVGNDAVGRLYEAWGTALWHGEEAEVIEVARAIEVPKLLADLGLPTELAEMGDATAGAAHQRVIEVETALARERAGDDIGTPVITLPGSAGRSWFGPVISDLPDLERSVALYDLLVDLAAAPEFSELKTTRRPPLALPVLGG